MYSGEFKIIAIYLKAFQLFQPHYFIPIIYFSIFLFLLLLLFILFYVYRKSAYEAKKRKWDPIISQLIQNALFREEPNAAWDDEVPADKINAALKKTFFKNYFTEELIKAKLNFTENIALNIKHLYEHFALQNNSKAKLKSARWHIKVKGIQELSIMDQTNNANAIFRLTNHKNPFVRSEAQCALIDFFGFSGLRFLNVAIYTITEWQQIQLLNKLIHIIPENFKIISQWLQSKNESVVIFALKLISHYKCYELYNEALHCLQHPSDKVNIHAVKCLQQIYREDTSDTLLNHYTNRSKNCQMVILQSLFGYSQERESEFLLQELTNSDHDIKLSAARALATFIPNGKMLLSNSPLINNPPWKEILLQIKSEAAA